MTASPARGHRFSQIICGLLVTFLSLAFLRMAPSSPSLADQLVTQSRGSSASERISERAYSEPVHNSSTESTSSTPASADGAAATSDAHPLDRALRLAYDALSRFNATVDDYTGTIIKRERVAGSLSGESRIEFKIRARKTEGDKLVRPLQVYLKFIDPWLARGREVIWVENANEGKLIAHEGGLKNLVRVSLAPTDSLAMMGNKYPITEIGLGKLVEKLIEKGERDKKVGPCEVKIEEGFEVAGRRCQKIEVIHPTPDARFDFHMAQIFIDAERLIPLRYAAYLWPEKPGAPPPLEEEYTYVDVQLNVGLKDSDFDPNNSTYKFP